MADFEEALLQIAAPRLKTLGYEYDPRLRLDDELFGFHKDLGDDVQAVIQFQRRRTVTQDDFTINLISAHSDDIRPRLYGGYAGARGARLSYVLWFVHHLRDESVADYWWDARDEAHLKMALTEAVGYVARYGVSWLEAPQPPRPWEMPTHQHEEFAASVRAVIAPELERLGYRLEQGMLAGDAPYLYFSKALSDDTCALIEMHSIYSLDPNEFNFDVRLQCRPDRNPLAPVDPAQRSRHVSLAQLVWHAHGAASPSTMTLAEVKALFWRYRNRAELNEQLRAALQQIVQIGLPWVEQPDDPAW